MPSFRQQRAGRDRRQGAQRTAYVPPLITFGIESSTGASVLIKLFGYGTGLRCVTPPPVRNIATGDVPISCTLTPPFAALTYTLDQTGSQTYELAESGYDITDDFGAILVAGAWVKPAVPFLRPEQPWIVHITDTTKMQVLNGTGGGRGWAVELASWTTTPGGFHPMTIDNVFSNPLLDPSTLEMNFGVDITGETGLVHSEDGLATWIETEQVYAFASVGVT